MIVLCPFSITSTINGAGRGQICLGLHCATSRKVAGSILDGVVDIFIYLIISAALGLWDRLSL